MITGAEVVAAKGFIDQIGGVIGKLTKVFDNSTSKWKSRLPELMKLTPDQRISFYINEMLQRKPFHGSVVQYAELFGNAYNGGKGTDDRGKVSYSLLKEFNDLVESVYFRGSDTYKDGHVYSKKSVMNDLTRAVDYAKQQTVFFSRTDPKNGIFSTTPNVDESTTKKAGFNFIPLILIGIVATLLGLILKPKKGRR